jgi:hypothetical protein
MEIIEYTTQHTNSLSTICKPLFENFPIKEVGYIKVFKTGHFLHLSTSDIWLRKCYESKVHDNYQHYKSLIHSSNVNKLRILLRFGEPANQFSSFQYNNDFWNSMMIFNKTANYFEGLAFFSSRENSNIINLYLENSNLFKKFMFYFKERLSDVINPSNLSAVWKPASMVQNTHELFNGINYDAEKFKDFLSKIYVKQLKIDNRRYLTLKEAECLYYLSKGKSTKEVAKILMISSRTIETHLRNMQYKLGLFCKAGCIEFFLENKLYDFFE